MEQNGWQPDGKLLASGNAVSAWNGGRQRSEDGGSTSCLDGPARVVPARRSRAVAGRLQLIYDHPVHTLCITVWTVALSPLDPEFCENQGDASLTDDPGSSFTTVWNAVVSELNGESTPDSGATNRTTLITPLTPRAKSLAESRPAAHHRRGICSFVGAEQLCPK